MSLQLITIIPLNLQVFTPVQSSEFMHSIFQEIKVVQ